ncbi:hypothetical protein HMPREF0322_00469 [Desulfitobacterium hafniense DP7]|uniref:Uncharacterized protein n=2 Tax=Desulfitobacterium hafniense TaxID=49338 RepID=Q24ZH7_DESHY|nr:hypothetical protein HMPREF0322_00469 [Desulfitobacterium hafniense DP7]BAE82565.1 hypothetical protein DSY0776 [Desulfitobacterium hafniense Y51]
MPINGKSWSMDFLFYRQSFHRRQVYLYRSQKKWINQPFKNWHDICIKSVRGKEHYRDGGCFRISSSVEKIPKVEEVRRQFKSMFKPHKCER